MARMLGRKVWYGVFCTCCNGPRSVKTERAREKREFARELHPAGLLPTAEPEDGDCLHGCNGGCLYSGSERCNFTCHDLGPNELELFDRFDRRVMEALGDEMLMYAEACMPLTVEAFARLDADWEGVSRAWADWLSPEDQMYDSM